MSMHQNRQRLLAGAIELKDSEDDPAAIVQKALDDLQKNVEDRLKAVESNGLQDRLDKIEAKMNRPGTGADAEKKATQEAETKAWVDYLRKGVRADDLTLKTLTVANDAQAGYLAPAEISNEMIRDLVQVSPLRQFATVRQSLAPSVKYPRRTGITNALWEGETETSVGSDPTFGQTEIVSKRLTTFVDMSNSLMMGSYGMAESEVRLALADDFAQKEGLAFVSGDGVKQPEGLLTNPDVIYFPNGSTTVITTDSLIGLMYSLPAYYRSRGSWVLNGNSLAAIRKLKDGQGNYLWQPSFQAGQPETILGRPVAEMVDFPDVAAQTFPVLFGDIATAYRIVDRQQLGILSDPYTQARNAITRLHGTRWVGGGVVQPKAIKKLKMAAS